MITGRLTQDAKITTTRDNKQVVHFSVAENESYRKKGSTEITKLTTYFDCSYWISPKVATWLKKGVLVELRGRAGSEAYINNEGKAVSKLTINARDIRPLAFPAKGTANGVPVVPAAVAAGQTDADIADDLPF